MTKEQAENLVSGDEVLIRGSFIRTFDGDLMMLVKCHSTLNKSEITEKLVFAIPEVVSLPITNRKEQNNG